MGCIFLWAAAAGAYFHWDEVAPFGDEKADRRVMAGTAGDLKRVCAKAGMVAGRHAHDFEPFFGVLEGGVLTTACGDVALSPGVVVHFEPDVWHAAVFETDTMLLEVTFRKGLGFLHGEPA